MSSQDEKYDRIQVAMFRTLFELRVPTMGIDAAFVTAIADTSDDVFRECIKERPELIKEYIKIYSEQEQ